MKSNLMKCLAVMMIFSFVAVAGAFAEETTITGTVEKTDQGIVLNGDDGGAYIVMGADLSNMVGKAVKATGTLAEGASGKTLTVVNVEPAGGEEAPAAPEPAK